MSYQVKLDVFEGPFDLLVYLIERSGMDIYTVNISEITDQYIACIRSGEHVNPEMAAEFMVLAATLLQLKSQMLLPGADVSGKNDELTERISEYRKYKALAAHLRGIESEAERIFVKPGEDLSRYTGQPEESLDVSMDQFIRAFRGFLEKRQRIGDVRRRYEYAARERMSMEEKAERIFGCLSEENPLSFEDLISLDSDIYDIVLTFVTLLELLAQGRISVRQSDIFGRMEICRKEGLVFG